MRKGSLKVQFISNVNKKDANNKCIFFHIDLYWVFRQKQYRNYERKIKAITSKATGTEEKNKKKKNTKTTCLKMIHRTHMLVLCEELCFGIITHTHTHTPTHIHTTTHKHTHTPSFCIKSF